jgi:hypothetical protein
LRQVKYKLSRSSETAQSLGNYNMDEGEL